MTRRLIVASVAAVAAFVLLALLGHLVDGARFYVPAPTDEPLAWVWRASGGLFAVTSVTLGWSLGAHGAPSAGSPARLVGAALAAGPACFVLSTLGWSDDAEPQELFAMQCLLALMLLALAAGVTGSLLVSRRARRAAPGEGAAPA